VTVDTTVQLKAITLPTDAKLVHAAIKGTNRLAACGCDRRSSGSGAKTRNLMGRFPCRKLKLGRRGGAVPLGLAS
jgi:hypothetical protein